MLNLKKLTQQTGFDTLKYFSKKFSVTSVKYNIHTYEMHIYALLCKVTYVYL